METLDWSVETSSSLFGDLIHREPELRYNSNIFNIVSLLMKTLVCRVVM